MVEESIKHEFLDKLQQGYFDGKDKISTNEKQMKMEVRKEANTINIIRSEIESYRALVDSDSLDFGGESDQNRLSYFLGDIQKILAYSPIRKSYIKDFEDCISVLSSIIDYGHSKHIPQTLLINVDKTRQRLDDYINRVTAT